MFDFIKRIMAKSSCPNCGWLLACDECSERYDHVDEDIDHHDKIRKESKLS